MLQAVKKCLLPDRRFESLCQADLFYKFTVGPSITPEPPAQTQAAHPHACEMLTSPFPGSPLRDAGLFPHGEANPDVLVA